MTIEDVLRESFSDLSAGAPVPSPDLPSQALRRLRRRRRRTVIAGVGAAVILAVPVGMAVARTSTNASPSKPPAPVCVESPLPLPNGGATAYLDAGDHAGRFMAGHVGSSRTLLLWDDGRLSRSVTSPVADAQAVTVSSSGSILIRHNGPNASESWVYQDGTMTRLRTDRDSGSDQATGLSDGGLISGTEQTLTPGPPTPGHPLTEVSYPIVWSSAGAIPQRLPLPAGSWQGEADGIASDGTIAGTVTPRSSVHQRGMIWFTNGTSRLLPLPKVAGAQQMWVIGISDGVVVGDLLVRQSGRSSDLMVIYDIATKSFTVITASDFHVVAADPRGWAIGNGHNAAYLWTRSSGVTVLAGGSNDMYAASLSGLGQVVGGEDVIHGREVPVEWVCR